MFACLLEGLGTYLIDWSLNKIRTLKLYWLNRIDVQEQCDWLVAYLVMYIANNRSSIARLFLLNEPCKSRC